MLYNIQGNTSTVSNSALH